MKWFVAFQRIFPTYLFINITFLLLTILAPIVDLPRGSNHSIPTSILWQSWYRWDATYYRHIAIRGYDEPQLAVFFPFYPLLMRGLLYLIPSPTIVGFLIPNVALLITCVILYQLVREDFGEEQADRTTLYLVLFPAAFFLVAAYSESLFLCLSALCFYQLRHGRWWLAGLFGFLGILTRSSGIFLVVPFFFEYLRQHQLTLRSLIRFDILSNSLIPIGLGIYCLYCYMKWGDFFAFSKQEMLWGRSFHAPWDGFVRAYETLMQPGFISIPVLYTLFEVSVDLFVLLFIIFSFIGPWRLPRTHWIYGIYALVAYLFFHCSTVQNNIPLESMIRYLMSIFPVFIMLSIMGEHRIFHHGYLIISSALLFFSTLLFLTGRWMT